MARGDLTSWHEAASRFAAIMAPMRILSNRDRAVHLGPFPLERVARVAAIHLPWTRGWIVRFDDAIGNGAINAVKTWWTDLEIVDGKVVAPRGTNRRELAPHKPVRAQEIAYYPSAAMPPPDAKAPVPVDRKAALAVRPETPADARARTRRLP